MTKEIDPILAEALAVARQTVAPYDVMCSGYPLLIAALVNQARWETIAEILDNEPLSIVDHAHVWRLFWETAAAVYESSSDDSLTPKHVLEYFRTFFYYWSLWYTEVFDNPPDDTILQEDFELKDSVARYFETSADKGIDFFVRHSYGTILYPTIAELPCFPFVREEFIERLVEHGDIELAGRIAATITDSLTERQAAFDLIGVTPVPSQYVAIETRYVDQ